MDDAIPGMKGLREGGFGEVHHSKSQWHPPVASEAADEHARGDRRGEGRAECKREKL